MNNITLDLFGNKGPKILLCLTIIFFIIYNIKILFIFLFGYYFNLLLNRILKKFINDKRPYIKPIENRMPSGHSQALFYTFGFVLFFVQYIDKMNYIHLFLLLIYLLIIINTIYITLKYNYHTIDQVIIGGILGILISYLIIFILKNNLKLIL